MPDDVQRRIVYLTLLGTPVAVAVAVAVDRFGVGRSTVYRLRRKWILPRYQRRH